MPTLHNPTGSTLPTEQKRELVHLLSRHDMPPIEDAAYAELQFVSTAPLPAKSFDERGIVLRCGSFSKCLAPGYRLGWVAAGRCVHDVARRKIESSLATSLPIQLAVAKMLNRGGYDAHLARLRQSLAARQGAAFKSLRRHLLQERRLVLPDGGYFFWIECPRRVQALEFHRQALEFGITIAPGPVFSPRRAFGNFIRLNTGHPWTAASELAMARLAHILKRV